MKQNQERTAGAVDVAVTVATVAAMVVDAAAVEIVTTTGTNANRAGNNSLGNSRRGGTLWPPPLCLDVCHAGRSKEFLIDHFSSFIFHLSVVSGPLSVVVEDHD